MSREVWERLRRLAELIERTARRSCSSTRAAWPSAPRSIFPSGSARRTWRRITAASPGSGGSTPRGASSAASWTRSSRLLRSSWASTSAGWTSSARWARPARSRGCCSASAAPDTRRRPPKGTLFPLSRDELVECAALLDAVRRDELDRAAFPRSRSTCWPSRLPPRWRGEDGRGRLFDARAPRPALPRASRARISPRRAHARGRVRDRRGRRGALVHYDAVNGRLRGRRGTRLAALTSRRRHPRQCRLPGGAGAGEQVPRHGERRFRGRGPPRRHLPARQHDVAHRARRSGPRAGRGRAGQSPTIPFWLGEAPGAAPSFPTRSLGCATRSSRMLDEREACAPSSTGRRAGMRTRPRTARRITSRPRRRALGRAADADDASSLERFFDESGGMQLVIHSPFGSRINRAWGLALRKRFCRKFNFELQAAATEDAIVLSLSTSHSFELAAVARYLHSNSVPRRTDRRRCSTRRCSPRGGAGSRRFRSRCRAFAGARRSPRRCNGCGPRI